MKKLFFSVLTLLLCSGLAWADGFKVSGGITFKVGTYTSFYPNSNDSIWLTAEDGVKIGTRLSSAYLPPTYAPVHSYEFASVEAGTYTISYHTSGYAGSQVQVSYSSSITVANEDLQHDFEAQYDPTHVIVSIRPQYLHPQYNYWAAGLDSVKVVCQKDSEEPEIQWTTESMPSVDFRCDTVSLYTFKLSCKGYKDTTFQIKALKEVNSYGISVGQDIQIHMLEELGTEVFLNGAVTMQGSTEQDTVNGLYLAVLWQKRGWVTEIKNGRQYAFDEPIPSGEIVYRLTTSPTYSSSLQPAKNWRFTSNNADTLHYELADNKDTVTNNLSIVRVGVDITGRLLDTLSSPGNPEGLISAWAKIYNETYQDSARTNNGIFELSGVQNGTYTLAFSKSGYATVTKEITIDLATIALDSTVQLGDFYSDPVEDDYVFYGHIYYMDPDTYSYVDVDSAKVVIIDKAGNRLDSVYTNEQGNWEITTRCYAQTQFTFEVTSPKINKAETTITAYSQRNNVYISCTAKTPDLIGMQNAKARQIKDSLKVELTWEWPEALTTGIANGTYNIFRIYINRTETGSQYPTSLGFLMPDNNTLPTSYVDSAQANQLEYGKTYTYFFSVNYIKPNGSIDVTDYDNLTVTIYDIIPVDSFNLVLEVEDPRMGGVTGEGRYETGTEVEIKAIPRPGYIFEAWMAGDTKISTDAEFTLVLTCDSTLKAIFAVEVVVPDSVTLTLMVNDAAMGTVEGDGKYEKGEAVTVKATANTGYSFVAWIRGTDTVAKTAEHTFTINENTTLTAFFVKETTNESREESAWNVYVENGQIVIRGNTACQYDVYNMAGTLVKQAKVNQNEYRISVNNSGLYIIRRISATGSSAKKIVVR